MKISKSSWHYKFYKKANIWGEPKDLCNYIRTVMFYCLVNGLLLIGLALFLTSYLIGGYDTFMQVFYHIKPTMPAFPAIFCSTTGMLIGVALLAGFFTLKDSYDTKRWNEIQSKNKPAPGFFSLLWKRFKDKTCHLVEIVD